MTDDLADLFVDVTGEASLTDEQRESHSRDPIDEAVASVESAVAAAQEDGLDDAVDGAEAQGSSSD